MDNEWIVLDENSNNKHTISLDSTQEQYLDDSSSINDVIEDIEKSINNRSRYVHCTNYNYRNYCFDFILHLDRFYNAILKNVFSLFNRYSVWKHVYKI